MAGEGAGMTPEEAFRMAAESGAAALGHASMREYRRGYFDALGHAAGAAGLRELSRVAYALAEVDDGHPALIEKWEELAGGG